MEKLKEQLKESKSRIMGLDHEIRMVTRKLNELNSAKNEEIVNYKSLDYDLAMVDGRYKTIETSKVVREETKLLKDMSKTEVMLVINKLRML